MDDDRPKNGPRLTEARHAARGLLKSANIIVGPVVINHLLKSVTKLFDLTIKGVPDALFNGKGDAVTQNRGASIFILYNDERPLVRKRFSVAHELGHLYLGHLHGNSSTYLDAISFDEFEANTFAAHLLMPPTLLRDDIRAGKKDVEGLAKKYQVSVEAMWWQIDKTSLLKLL